MESLRTPAVWLVGAAPIVALMVSMLSGLIATRVWRAVVRGIVIGSIVGAVGLLAEVVQTGGVIASPSVLWLSVPDLPGMFGLSVSWGWHLDGLSLLQSLLTSVVLLLVLARWPDEIPWRGLMLSWLGVSLVVLSNNLGQVVIGWMMSAWVSSELARRGDAIRRRPVWLVQRTTDAALLIGVGLIWAHFGGSLEFSAWTGEAIGQLRGEMIETISLWILIGVLGRCAQLPLTVWLESETGFAARSGQSVAKLSDEMVGLWNVPDGHQVAARLHADPHNRWHEPPDSSVSSVVLAWWLSAVFLPVGVGLLLRLAPIFSLAQHTQLLCVAAGAFTLLLTSASAAAQNNWPSVMAQLVAGQCGLVLMAIGLDPFDAAAVGFFTLFINSLLFAVLLIVKGCDGRHSHRLLAITATVIASGLWGQHVIFSIIWDRAFATTNAESEGAALGTSTSGILPLIIALNCLSALLTSFSLFRAWFLNARELKGEREQARHAAAETVSSERSGLADVSGFMMFVPSVVVVVVMVLGFWWGLSDRSQWFTLIRGSLPRTLPTTASGDRIRSLGLIGGGPLFPLSVIGVVLAAGLYARPSRLPEQAAGVMGPFVRLSRNRFYWDDLYFLLFVQPLTQACLWLKWLDDVVWNRCRLAVHRTIARMVGESLEPLTVGGQTVFALTALGSVVVLTWMLVWLRTSL